MVNPAAEVNARFSPLVVRVQLCVFECVCVRIKCRHTFFPLFFSCMSEEAEREREGGREGESTWLQNGKEMRVEQKAGRVRRDKKLSEKDGLFFFNLMAFPLPPA